MHPKSVKTLLARTYREVMDSVPWVKLPGPLTPPDGGTTLQDIPDWTPSDLPPVATASQVAPVFGEYASSWAFHAGRGKDLPKYLRPLLDLLLVYRGPPDESQAMERMFLRQEGRLGTTRREEAEVNIPSAPFNQWAEDNNYKGKALKSFFQTHTFYTRKGILSRMFRAKGRTEGYTGVSQIREKMQTLVEEAMSNDSPERGYAPIVEATGGCRPVLAARRLLKEVNGLVTPITHPRPRSLMAADLPLTAGSEEWKEVVLRETRKEVAQDLSNAFRGRPGVPPHVWNLMEEVVLRAADDEQAYPLMLEALLSAGWRLSSARLSRNWMPRKTAEPTAAGSAAAAGALADPTPSTGVLTGWLGSYKDAETRLWKGWLAGSRLYDLSHRGAEEFRADPTAGMSVKRVLAEHLPSVAEAAKIYNNQGLGDEYNGLAAAAGLAVPAGSVIEARKWLDYAEQVDYGAIPWLDGNATWWPKMVRLLESHDMLAPNEFVRDMTLPDRGKDRFYEGRTVTPSPFGRTWRVQAVLEGLRLENAEAGRELRVDSPRYAEPQRNQEVTPLCGPAEAGAPPEAAAAERQVYPLVPAPVEAVTVAAEADAAEEAAAEAAAGPELGDLLPEAGPFAAAAAPNPPTEAIADSPVALQGEYFEEGPEPEGAPPEAAEAAAGPEFVDSGLSYEQLLKMAKDEKEWALALPEPQEALPEPPSAALPAAHEGPDLDDLLQRQAEVDEQAARDGIPPVPAFQNVIGV